MKRTIIIIAFLIVLISIPILSEANDSTQINLENSILQNEKIKLPWYKTLKYEIGYTGALTAQEIYQSKSESPFMQGFYWLAGMYGNVVYRINDDWKTSLGFEYYSFGIYPGRYPALSIPNDSFHTFPKEALWRIYSIPTVLTFYKKQSKNRDLIFGAIYYYAVAKSKTRVERYKSEKYDTLYVQTKHWHRGPGVFIGYGWTKRMTNKLDIYHSIMTNISYVNEYKYDFPSPFVKGWENPPIYFWGIYLKLSLILNP